MASCFSSKDPFEQYVAWVDLLAERLRGHVGLERVEVWSEKWIASSKNGIIVATKDSMVASTGTTHE